MAQPTTVSLFIPCLVDACFPEVGDALVRVFDRLAIPLAYPEGQTCCGQPAFNSGYRREAAVAARRFLGVFAGAEAIVCPSGACVAMVRHHYPELFADDPSLLAQALALGQRTYEFSQYLVDILGVTELGAEFPARATYHDSCHLARTLGIREQPRELLRRVRGLELVEMEQADGCCGFGGTFSLGYPEISVALVDAKIEHILKSGADTVVGCDVSCLMQIRGRLTRQRSEIRVRHIAEIVAAGGCP